MENYSQGEEQRAILYALGYGGDEPKAVQNEERKYLDIGAWNAKTFSNTRALYELGWSGVMIEPSPGPMLSLIADYGEDPRITLVQAAVGLTHSFDKLYVTEDAVSTTTKEQYEQWKDHAKFIGVVLVPTITWEEIANLWGGFSFVNIDAEGLSVDLFHEMLRLGLYPPCVCVEHDGRTTELLSAATGKDYRAVFVNGTNAVLAR